MEVKKTPNRGSSADVRQSDGRSCTQEPPPADKRKETSATPNSAYALNPPFRGEEYLSNKVLDADDNEVDLQEAFQNELETGLEGEGYVDNQHQPVSDESEGKNDGLDFLDSLFDDIKDPDDLSKDEVPTLDLEEDMEELMGSKYTGSDLFAEPDDEDGYSDKF